MTVFTRIALVLVVLVCVAAAPATRPRRPLPPSAPADGPQGLAIPLPKVPETMIVAGYGRFLLVPMAEIRRLAVVDLHERKVVKQIDLPSEKTLVAGGAEKFVLADPPTRQLQRWSLSDFERELVVELPNGETPTELALGASSAGPVCVKTDAEQRFFSLLDFTPLAYAPPKGWSHPTERVPPVVYLAPSGIGYLCMEGPLRFGKASLDRVELGAARGGSSLDRGWYSIGRRRWDPSGRQCEMAEPRDYGWRLIPHPAFFLGRPYGHIRDVQVVLMGVNEPLAKYPLTYVGDEGDIHHFMPSENIAAAFEKKPLITLYPVDTEGSLAKLAPERVYVVSNPPVTARPGSAYEYQVEWRGGSGLAKDSPVRFELGEAPQGMKVSPEGKLTWQVPATARGCYRVDLAVIAGKARDPYNFAVWVGQEKAGKPASPPLLAGKLQTIDLPGPVTDLALAGGEKYLLLVVPSVKRLVVFDNMGRKIAAQVPLASEKAVVAGGASMFVLGYPEQGVIERWSLATMKPEARMVVPRRQTLSGLAMGWNSEGPLFMVTTMQEHLVDLKAMRPLAVPGFDGHRSAGQMYAIGAADGSAFLCLYPEWVRHFALLWDLGGKEAKAWGTQTDLYAVLNAASKHRAARQGLLNANLDAENVLRPPYYLPARSGGCYLKVDEGRDQQTRCAVSLFEAGSETPITFIPATEELAELAAKREDSGKVQVARTMFLLPEAKALVMLDKETTHLRVRDMDLAEAVRRAGKTWPLGDPTTKPAKP